MNPAILSEAVGALERSAFADVEALWNAAPAEMRSDARFGYMRALALGGAGQVEVAARLLDGLGNGAPKA